MYWELRSDVFNEAVSKAMARNRFNEILKFLHLANNDELPPNDKFGKLRPLLLMLNKRFATYQPNEQSLSIDESMVPYYGRHGTKQCIRNKPIRFVFKTWVLATSTGYVIQVDPYQGSSSSYNKSLGLGYCVVTNLLDVLPRNLPFTVTFDNFFTSLRLISDLALEGIGATGTLRANRLQNCPITPVKDLAKQSRGSYDFRFDRQNEVIVVNWNDNNVVTLASNMSGVFPMHSAKRWSMKDKKYIQVEQPHVVHEYNKTMGGVDLMDQNVSCYRINMRTKKWWWPFFAYCLDVSIQNAWMLFRKGNAEHTDQLAFRREIVDVYLRRYAVSKQPHSLRSAQVTGLDKKVPSDVRQDGRDHFITSEATQRRCAYCGKKTYRRCSKCRVALHLECSQVFHT